MKTRFDEKWEATLMKMSIQSLESMFDVVHSGCSKKYFIKHIRRVQISRLFEELTNAAGYDELGVKGGFVIGEDEEQDTGYIRYGQVEGKFSILKMLEGGVNMIHEFEHYVKYNGVNFPKFNVQ